jgi:hypothetical protein
MLGKKISPGNAVLHLAKLDRVDYSLVRYDRMQRIVYLEKIR